MFKDSRINDRQIGLLEIFKFQKELRENVKPYCY